MNLRACVLVWLLSSGVALAQEMEPTEEWTQERASALFQEKCTRCHFTPDLRFATDKAWFGQISETA